MCWAAFCLVCFSLTSGQRYALGVTMVTFVTREDVFLEYWTGTSLRFDFVTHLYESDIRPPLPTKPYKCPAPLRSLLEACWHRDPHQRPSCVDIVDTFERTVLLACAVQDPTMQQVWATQVCKASKQAGLLRSIAFEQLEKILLPVGTDGGDAQKRLVLYKLFRNEWDAFGLEICTLSHVGRVCGFFPPMRDSDLITQALQLTRHHWFWGDSSRFEVEFVLRMSPVGTFVVRFANQASFRLSIRFPGDETRHFYVRHAYQGLTYGIKGVPGLEKKSFSSLEELAHATGAEFGLTLVSPHRSPFLVD